MFPGFATLLHCAALALSPAVASPIQEAPASAQLASIVAEEWSTRLADQPLLASAMGSGVGADRLPDVSPAAQKVRVESASGFLARLKAVDPSELDGRDVVTRSMLIAELERRIESVRFREYEIPLNADSGFHTSFARLPEETEFESAEDVRNYIARMRAFPGYVEAQMANMRAGQERGFVLPRACMLGMESALVPYVVDVESHPFFRRLDELPEGLNESERAELVAAGRVAVEEAIIPGFQAFHDFLATSYIPGGTTTLGASDLPNGDAYYAYLVRRYTTLDQTAQEVHDIGLAEVARIRAEMEAVIAGLDFDGSFADFLSFLRTDEQFYARSAEELLARAARICKDIDGRLPRYFKRLPRQPYGVEPVPLAIAPKYTAGRYVRAPLDSDRAGTYWVNTYALESRPLYALRALSLHEAVPGHHLQIALNAELESLPPFRQNSSITAFVEGWALYAEHLGVEMGIYETPYDHFGRLTYEMWRACRLVVDTGLHQFGWTRQQAIDYLASNTALSIHECTTEVDRYISWPGQALAYKTGEIEIRRLRHEAKAALGDSFDVADFHRVVLEEGTVPLSVLRANVEAWVQRIGQPNGPAAVEQKEPLRVLILGDSISVGYTPFVQKALAGHATVLRPTNALRTGDPSRKGAENCQGTNNGVVHLERWLAIEGGHWDVIHFNFGLHDLKRVQPDSGKNSNNPDHPYQASPETYEAQLRTITERLKETGAALIFATTTPVPEGDVRPHRAPADAVQYNAIARRVMKDLGVPVNDLFALVEASTDPIQKPANVHFTAEGSRALADEVTACILRLAQARGG
ncbi:MAG: DUF885 family protein [Planctomycetota bacterium]